MASFKNPSSTFKKVQKQEREWLGVSFKPENFIPGLIIGFIFGFFLDLSKPAKTSGGKKVGGSLLGRNHQQSRTPSTNNDEELKMVLVVRQDLKMGSGKIASQCAHAATGMYSELMYSHRSLLRQWELCGQPKIVVTCKNQQEMNKVKDAAESIGLPTFTVADAGRTQVFAGSKTVLAIGPGALFIQSFPPFVDNGFSLQSNLKTGNQPSQNHHYEALEQTRLFCSINALLIHPFLKAIASNGCPPVSVTSPHCSLLGQAHFLSRCRRHGLQVFVSGTRSERASISNEMLKLDEQA
ncbi:Peptidyl-tRNA hydrolase 2, mitochondrial [Sesamum alatum]|uniref:peptidyl-tRNA hydrolase n=1 Tax=Sesamum alatum TaxID=300844 RepID=A0AAE1Y2X9_9LAMI|nr:Peptidyl-tRNA hydrolase 2, mitochondrial [Sesamum alatum]